MTPLHVPLVPRVVVRRAAGITDMAEPAYRPLEVMAVLEAVGIAEGMQEKFFEATERSGTLSLDALADALKGAGLSVKERVAVKKQLEGGPVAAVPSPVATSAAVVTGMTPLGELGAALHEAGQPSCRLTWGSSVLRLPPSSPSPITPHSPCPCPSSPTRS